MESAQESAKKCSLRGQLDFDTGDSLLDVSEVEEAANIVKRFCTGTHLLLIMEV